MPTRYGNNVVDFPTAATGDTTFSGGASLPGPDATGIVVASTSLPARTSQIYPLQDLGEGASFIHPLYVVVEQSNGEFLATSADLGLVGRGETDLAAMDDLREQVAELFSTLRELKDTLGPHLLNQLAFLNRLAGTS